MEDVDVALDAALNIGQSAQPHFLGRSPLTKSKTRSLSDGGGTPSKLCPSPLFIDPSRRTSKDDSNLKDLPPPETPRRSGLALQFHMPSRQFTPPPAAATSAFARPAPLSPQLDHSHIYASPTNILPRRSRGLDFSRAATSLHHSTLATGDSSPLVAGAPMNIPARRPFGPEHTSTSLWSVMGNQEKMNCAHSYGSNNHAIASDASSSSDDDDMDEDMDDNFLTTPMASRTSMLGQPPPGAPFGSPAMGSLMSFQQRQRHRKSFGKKRRGPVGLGFHHTLGFHSGASSISNSPPGAPAAGARRESISWQANQLHISAADAEAQKMANDNDTVGSEGQPSVVLRRTATRRGNLLPKTKGFARIRAALMEEVAPADAECKREAEVVKQVRESDPPPPPSHPSAHEPPAATLTQESLHNVPEDDMMRGLVAGLSGSFKQHAMRNSKGTKFWDTFSETSSVGGARTTPPPPSAMPRCSFSGMSEDVPMDSPSHNLPPTIPPWGMSRNRADSLRSEGNPWGSQTPPSAAEITRRINNKRRRDDDFDPCSIKRRAVSPGLSVHNSPVVQSPMQRDVPLWGSRPGSNGGDRGSDSGSMSGTPGTGSGSSGRVNGKGRVGLQGMVDTNDGIMRMSIE